MKIWIAAAVLFLASFSPPLKAECITPPDFSWGADCVNLSQAREKWQAAAVVVSSKEPKASQPQEFDERYLQHMLTPKDFGNSAYQLLDDAMRRSRILEESNKLYHQALEQCKPTNADALGKSFDASYHRLRYSLALALALARAGIAQKMAASGSSSYCFQAMESAIDTLTTAQKDETDKKRLESLGKLRSKLFDSWEQAQRKKDVKLILDFDLLRAFDESVPLHKT